MIEPGHKKLSVRRQAARLGVNRNRLPKASERAEPPPCEDLAILKDLDALHMRWPLYGQGKLRLELRDRGWDGLAHPGRAVLADFEHPRHGLLRRR